LDPGVYADLRPDSGPFVFHLHGKASDAPRCVLAKRSYDELIADPRYVQQLGSFANQRTLLFVGHSVSDPDLALVLDGWQTLLGRGAVPRHFLLGAYMSAAQKAELRESGIEPVDCAGFEHIPDVLRWLAEPPSAAPHTTRVAALPSQSSAPARAAEHPSPSEAGGVAVELLAPPKAIAKPPPPELAPSKPKSMPRRTLAVALACALLVVAGVAIWRPWQVAAQAAGPALLIRLPDSATYEAMRVVLRAEPREPEGEICESNVDPPTRALRTYVLFGGPEGNAADKSAWLTQRAASIGVELALDQQTCLAFAPACSSRLGKSVRVEVFAPPSMDLPPKASKAFDVAQVELEFLDLNP
jgi:hypothetical protein